VDLEGTLDGEKTEVGNLVQLSLHKALSGHLYVGWVETRDNCSVLINWRTALQYSFLIILKGHPIIFVEEHKTCFSILSKVLSFGLIY
jgi:hypothetical protein